jgi:type IV pilus assembly protein PilW
VTWRPHRLDRRAPRGVTLVELLVGLAVVSVVLALAGSALVSTLREVSRGARQRGSQEQSRDAAAFVERSLRLAGLGVEPALAFDFNVYRGLGASCTAPGQVPPSADCQRDFANRPDELVFYARDPAYWGSTADAGTEGRAWTVAAVDAVGSTLTLTLHGGEVLLPGQIIQVVCSGGAKVAYVTNQTRVSNPARGTVKLLALGATAAGDPFNQPVAMAPTCFGDGTARAFAVDRYRFHVASYADGAQKVPYLMLDTGLDRTGAGVADPANEIPIAEGIEDFQVVYERPSGPGPGAVENAWVGETPGTVLDPNSFCARTTWTGAITCGVPDPPLGGLALVNFAAVGAANYETYSFHRYGTSSPMRQSPDTANVRAVRIAITARSLRIDSARNDTGRAPQPLFNRTASTAPWPAMGVQDGFERSVLIVTVPVRNLLSKGISYF